MTDFSGAVSAVMTEMQNSLAHIGASYRLPDIIAVSKKQPDERIAQALTVGWRRFGENIVQEAKKRWQERRKAYPDIELHLIGPLQSNKAADAVALFDVIHTVDRRKIAQCLAQEMAKQEKNISIFIQVNTGAEAQKSGVALEDLSDLLDYCQNDLKLSVRGLMCIPPVTEDPALHFALLKKLLERHGLSDLSMGMSSDYPVAAAFGARYVRIGTALFGDRQSPATL